MICSNCKKETNQVWPNIGDFEFLCQDCWEAWEDEDFEEWILMIDKAGEALND
jgi:hypothetical protein